MPLSLYDKLPAAVLHFGLSNEEEISFAYHLNSFTAMNTGSLILHQWIITTYPEIVDSYEQYDDENSFQPITPNFAIPASKAEKDTDNNSAMMKDLKDKWEKLFTLR